MGKRHTKSGHLRTNSHSNKELFFLPPGVSFDVQPRNEGNRSTQIYFKIRYHNNGEHTNFRLYVGVIHDLEEADYLQAQNAAIAIRTEARRCYYADEFFDISPYMEGRWRRINPVFKMQPKNFSYEDYVYRKEAQLRARVKPSSKPKEKPYIPRKRYFTSS